MTCSRASGCDTVSAIKLRPHAISTLDSTIWPRTLSVARCGYASISPSLGFSTIDFLVLITYSSTISCTYQTSLGAVFETETTTSRVRESACRQISCGCYITFNGRLTPRRVDQNLPQDDDIPKRRRTCERLPRPIPGCIHSCHQQGSFITFPLAVMWLYDSPIL